jgi:hypothetical protein
LASHVGQALPFYYEVGYFESGAGFLSIGEAKELHRIYKTQRTKGNGEEGKIDKKKVAYGEVRLNQEGIYEFVVEQGKIKKNEAKAVIKSIKLLKQQIGDQFTLLHKAPVESTEEEENEQEESVGISKKLENQFNRLDDNLTKVLEVLYKRPKNKLQANLEKFKEHLETWKTEQVNNSAALTQIETLSKRLQGIEERLAQREDTPEKNLPPKQREKINDNLVELHTRVDGLLSELESLMA